jgi:murein DD-endopeptidase MepM/ murein hydrolase activator NlpD
MAVDTVRDLGEVDLWEESLQRSLARRGRVPRSSPEMARLRPTRDLSDENFMRQHASYTRRRRDARARRPLMPVVGLGGVSSIAVLVATLPGLLGGKSASARAARLAYIGHSPRPTGLAAGGSQPAARPVLRRLPPRQLIPRARVERRATTTAATPAVVTTPAIRPKPAPAVRTAVATTPKPVPAVRPDVATAKPVIAASDRPTQVAAPTPRRGYVNPLAHASVTPERIDQGVDYGGMGPLEAIGAGRITYVGTSGTGWPGAFIEFQLSSGPDAGRYVYYAEGIVPAQGLHVGQRISAGQTIATMTGSSGGIEIGWGAGIGTESYAMKVGQWRSGMDEGDAPTASGKSFSALVASLGGPAGKIEG